MTSEKKEQHTVLVVDDEAGICDALCDLLVDAGYEAVVARNGNEALRRAAEIRPDVIVLDYMMPVMDGAEALAALRADERLRGIPVIMMSATPGKGLLAALGTFELLRKPFSIDALLGAIKRALGEEPSSR